MHKEIRNFDKDPKGYVNYTKWGFEWGKYARVLDIGVNVDFSEDDWHFKFRVPFLFGIRFTVGFNKYPRNWFKDKRNNDKSYEYGIWANEEFINVMFNYQDHWDGNEVKGFSWSSDWTRLLKGNFNIVDLPTVKTEEVILDLEDKEGNVTKVTFVVKHVPRVIKYKRWFKKTIMSFDVSSDHMLDAMRASGKSAYFGGNNFLYLGDVNNKTSTGAIVEYMNEYVGRIYKIIPVDKSKEV